MAGDPEIAPLSGIGRGEVIAGKYVVDRVIGMGGMGVVVAALHRELDLPVAIKLLLPKVMSNPVAVSRFLREARAAVHLKSEHIARILDVGSLESGVPFIVMELLQGTDLGAIITAGRRVPVAEAVGYVVQACEAVAEAHRKGIIHRDLKPSNLFLTTHPDGSPLIKVFDFGIAKLTAEEPEQSVRLTSTGSGMGSPQYMSPEQVRDASRVDARTDIWALGVTLYELVAGEPPFSGATFSALCAQIIVDAPLPLRARRKDAPPELEAVILRCLEKAPERRFAGAAELAAALLPFGPNAGELSVPTAMVTPSRTSSPRGLALLGLVGGGAVLAGVIFLVASSRGGDAPQKQSATPTASALAASAAPLPLPLTTSDDPPAASTLAAVAPPTSASSPVLPASARKPAPASGRGTKGHDPLDDRK